MGNRKKVASGETREFIVGDRPHEIKLSGLRILRVISSMDPRSGGPAQGIRNSIPTLDALGCVNEVACFDAHDSMSVGPEKFPIHSMGKAFGIWGWSPHLKPWLQKHLCDYDVVIVHGIWQYHCYAVTQAITRLRANGAKNIPRVFVMPHGMLDPWFQTALSRYWKAWRNWTYWKTIENRTISQADGLLFTCEQEMLLARTTFRPYSPKQEHNVGYGIAEPPRESAVLQNAFRKACPQLANRPYLLYLGRIHEKKGIDLLLKVYAGLSAELANGTPMPALVVAGPNDGAYAKQMQHLWLRLSRTSDIGDSNDPQNAPSVFFPGMLQGDAKWGAIYGCDAMVLPSHQENFGIAIVEALACGKPVLISDKVNICLEIEKDGAGWVETDTLDGVSRLLRNWIAASDDTRNELGRNAMRCYENRYRAEGAAGRLVELLEASESRLAIRTRQQPSPPAPHPSRTPSPPAPLPRGEGSKRTVGDGGDRVTPSGPRLLHGIAGMDPRAGGVCQAIRTTIPELALLGWHNEVVCVDSPSFDYKITDPFVLHKLGPKFGPAAYSKQLFPWLRDNATKFDSIIIHGLWSYHSYAMIHLLHQLRRSHAKDIPRAYVMPHGMLDPWFQRDASRRFKAWRNWW